VQYKIEYMPIEKLQVNPENPRLIKDKAFKSLVKSLKDCPSLFDARPCLCSDRTGELIILAGNMRYLAAKELKYKEVPVIVMSGLSEIQEREILLKDNGMTWGEWDMDLLSSWSDLPLVDWGVDLPEDWLKEEETVGDAEPQIDKAEELNKVWQAKLGDLWQIGEHRLLCGDSTKKEDVERLMGGEKALLMVTDPPYGVDYDPDWRNRADRANGKPYGASAIGLVTNDNRVDWTDAYLLFNGDVAYVWHCDRSAKEVSQNIEDAGFDIISQCIWAKNNFVISRGDYHYKHEPCWYAVRKGKNHNWQGSRSETSLWEIDKPLKSETGHSTQKPIECMARPIRNNSAISESVYDPFLGSGTTMVACQNLNRKCRGIEISPQYVAVCLERMKTAFSGIEIKRL
jgi:DNA modification methylase